MQQWLEEALLNAVNTLNINADNIDWTISTPKNMLHGDLTTNIAMVYSRIAQMPPRALADQIIEKIPQHPNILSVMPAGPGFINITYTDQFRTSIIDEINHPNSTILKPNLGHQQSLLLEFVSANPTGPLHVGHGRAAALGSALSNFLKHTEHHVTTHYFINDAGNQMHTLAITLWLQYLSHHDHKLQLPEDAYQGSYMNDIAKDWRSTVKDQFDINTTQYPKKNTILDWIQCFKLHFGDQAFQELIQSAYQPILTGIKKDLELFKTTYDEWVSEQSIHDELMVETTINQLKESGKTFEKDGALWFQSTHWGDDKDRVLIRANGLPTYFCSDIAYHYNSFLKNQPNLRLNIFGADHHGYITRLQAAMIALGIPKEQFSTKIVQFVSLFRGSEKESMSTRSGQFVTLKALFDEIGTDATRYFYLSTKSDQHIDFDIDLAKSKTNANPVFYIQYAHARLSNVLHKAQENTYESDTLDTEEERRILHHLREIPKKLNLCIQHKEPQIITIYLHELAGHIHSYYHKTRILDGNPKQLNIRLKLLKACQKTMQLFLDLLGISAPEKM